MPPPSRSWDLIQGMVHRQEALTSTSVSSRQVVCQQQREVKNIFLLLRGVLSGMTSEYVAAAFKEDANEQV